MKSLSQTSFYQTIVWNFSNYNPETRICSSRKNFLFIPQRPETRGKGPPLTTFDLFWICSWNGGNKYLLVHALDYEMIVCPLYLAHASDQCAVAFRTPSLGSFPSRCFGLRATKDVSYSLIFAWAVLNYAQAFYD